MRDSMPQMRRMHWTGQQRCAAAGWVACWGTAALLENVTWQRLERAGEGGSGGGGGGGGVGAHAPQNHAHGICIMWDLGRR